MMVFLSFYTFKKQAFKKQALAKIKKLLEIKNKK